MPTKELKRGDKGEEVVKLQSHLNKTGAMLIPDGNFGSGTVRGVKYAQDVAQVPVTGIADIAFQSWLENQSDPFPPLDTNGVAFIARSETGGLAYYDSYTKWPSFPGEVSGITIGVGYDLKFNSKDDFTSVWGSILPASVISELGKDIGKAGTTARAQELKRLGIIIPFKAAWQAFIKKTLPRFYNETQNIYPSIDHLPKVCSSVLVSLVFNRGSSLSGSSRVEMKEIRDILSEAEKFYPDKLQMKSVLAGVETRIISMKRLWAPNSGLIKRRQDEADLWHKGLAEWE